MSIVILSRLGLRVKQGVWCHAYQTSVTATSRPNIIWLISEGRLFL